MDINIIVWGNDEYKCNECIDYILSLKYDDADDINLYTVMNSDSIMDELCEIKTISDADINIFVNENILIINKELVDNCINILRIDNRIATICVGIGETSASGVKRKVGKAYVDELGKRTVLFDEGRELSNGHTIEIDCVVHGVVVFREKISLDMKFDSMGNYINNTNIELSEKGYRSVVVHDDKVWCIIGSGVEDE